MNVTFSATGKREIPKVNHVQTHMPIPSHNRIAETGDYFVKSLHFGRSGVTLDEYLRRKCTPIHPDDLQRLEDVAGKINVVGSLTHGGDSECAAVLELEDGRVLKIYKRGQEVPKGNLPWDVPIDAKIEFPNRAAVENGYDKDGYDTFAGAVITHKIQEVTSLARTPGSDRLDPANQYNPEASRLCYELKTFMHARGYKYIDGFQVGLFDDPDIGQKRPVIYDPGSIRRDNPIYYNLGRRPVYDEYFDEYLDPEIARKVAERRPVFEQAAALCDNLEWYHEDRIPEASVEELPNFKKEYAKHLENLKALITQEKLEHLIPPSYLKRFEQDLK